MTRLTNLYVSDQLLETYERKRDAAACPDLRAHPGIEAIQSILGYFKLNGIKTKVVGTTFREVSNRVTPPTLASA